MDDELFLRYRFIDNHLIKIWAVFLGGIVDWERRRPFSCPQFPLGDSLPRRRRKKYEHSIGIQVKKKNKQTYKQKFTSKFHRRRAPNFTGSNCQVDQKRNIIILDHHHHHDDCDSFFLYGGSRKQNGVLQFGRDPSPRRCQRVFLVFLPFLSTSE